MTKSIRLLVCFVLALGLTAPAWATVNDSEKPGSVLVFPKFIRGTFADPFVSGQAVHANTELEISVVCPRGETCGRNPITGNFERVFLRAHWVCPGCSEASFDLETTVNGSLFFNPEGVTDIGGLVTANAFPSNATTTIPTPPCLRGYLIVWVTDGAGNAIKFDGLIGDAILYEAGPGAATFLARAYNAVPIQASENFGTGNLTDVDLDGSLDFNGDEYKMVSGKIYGTVRYESNLAPGRTDTDITLLTLDVASNRPNPTTIVGLNFYTADEDLVDTRMLLSCWNELRLTQILPSLTQQRMGRKGLVESTYAEQHPDFFTTVPVTVLGILETKEFFGLTTEFRDHSYSLYNDGIGVPTTFQP